MKSLSLEKPLSIPSLSALCGILLSTTILLSISSAQAASPFTTEGKFSVGSDGSANYSIPIVVPPGTAGMQPQLALNYNSNGGNGIVGMGWGIDGLSQISRCSTTLEQDGVINGVNYTSTDRFCLDGQRLIATTDTYNATTKQYATTSAYGANGTEYRTESANFAKIISYGQAGTGPAYFKVWTKSGQIIEYGNTADSAIEAQGKPTIRTWGVNKISDTKGNYIAVTYTEDNANGEAYVQKIDYTGNAASTPAVTPYANVQFIYETRPDTNIAYQAGSVLKTTKRLINIQTYNATTLIKNYKLTYELSQSTNRSRLKTLEECNGSAPTPICKEPIKTQWRESGIGFAAYTYWSNYFGHTAGAGSWGDENVAPRHLVDVNGDGLPDMVGFAGSGVLVSLNTGSNFAPYTYWSNYFGHTAGAGSWSNENISPRHLTDVNGDGLPDVVGFAGSGVLVSLNTGSNFAPYTYWSNYFGHTTGAGSWGDENVAPRHLVDVNGDGLPDVVGFAGSGVLVSLNTGSNFAPYTYWSNYFGHTAGAGSWGDENISPRHLTDVNGDGLPDVVGFAGTGVAVALNPYKFPDFINDLTIQSTTVNYNYLSITNPLVYIKDTGSKYPVQNIQRPQYAVSSTSVSDGVGGFVTTTYQYGGLKSHLRGRGSLGFRYVKESSPDSGLSVTTFYRQDFPYIGLPSQVEKRRLNDNALLSVVQNTYANSDLATSTIISKFPYLSQSVEQAYELDGSLVSTTTTTNQYDNYGNVTSVKVDDGLGNIKTTASTYNNDVGNWLLGRLIRSTVTSVTP